MCLTVTWRKSKVARKPIICYKLMFPYGNGGEGPCVIHMDIHPNMKPVYFNSTVCRMKYELSAEYAEGKFMEALPEGWSRNCDIMYGFHSYPRLKDAEYERNDRAYVVVVKCEIPAGARYRKGNRKHWIWGDDRYFEYCSDKIKVLAWKHPYTGKWSNTK